MFLGDRKQKVYCLGAWLIIESKIENLFITVLLYATVRHQTPGNYEFEDFY